MTQETYNRLVDEYWEDFDDRIDSAEGVDF